MHSLARAPRTRRFGQLARGLASSARRTNATTSTTNNTAAVERKALKSILIANRGEIALRVNRTATQSGIKTTTIYTNPDANSQHTLSSPYSINLGAPSAYLDGDRIIEAALSHGCEAIHPGYGFLSENPTFARKCTEAGITFIGPPWQAIEAMGSKSRSKDIMTEAGVPCIPGYHGSEQDPDFLKTKAQEIGYPVLLKAVKGGGGKGMRIVQNEEEFMDQLASAKSEAMNSFGDQVMLVEKYITQPRHIEVQVFADKHGNCVALGERDCSIQRRHQKILEESPAPHLAEDIRQDIWGKARAAALAVGYEGAGTVEFIFDNETNEFFFMEMNTRLQVEHPVTEMVTGEDLVKWQIIVAEGGKLPLTQDEVAEKIKQRGHAIEARIYAENPDMGFIPDSGRLTHLRLPTLSENVRVDAGFIEGDEVSSHYDPMIAKLIVRGENRTEALAKLAAALEEYQIAGPVTNVEFLKRCCVSPAFVKVDVETGYIQKYREELFAKQVPPREVIASAALGLILENELTTEGAGMISNPWLLGTERQSRVFELLEPALDGKGDPSTHRVELTQLGPSEFRIAIDGTTFNHVTATTQFSTPNLTNRTTSEFTTPSDQPLTQHLTTYFPHTLLTTTLIRVGPLLTLFQRGRQYRLQIAPPKWAQKALGLKETKNSVLAPMPCKVLRVEVKEGDVVRKNQALVVIESMKMETVIRSGQDGVIRRVVHRAGDLCKAGTALVEFVEEGEEEAGDK